jgi:hypothetical protein
MPDTKTPLHPKSPLPIGTKVIYHGSHLMYHGEYVVTSTVDRTGLEAVGRNVKDYFIDWTGYELWPLGIEQTYRNRELSLRFVRRGSITPIQQEEKTTAVTIDDIRDFRDLFLDDPEFTSAVGTVHIPRFAAIFDLAEKSLIREADSGA